MQFRYEAKSAEGERRSGMVLARSRREALRKMKGRDFSVMSLHEYVPKRRYYIGTLSGQDKVTLTKHLSVMLEAGISMKDAIDILILQSKKQVSRIMKDVRGALEGGETLADALAAHPRHFDAFYINMVHAGEESGSLPESLERLADRMAKDLEIKKKALSALIYPSIMTVLTIGLGAMVSVFVLPRLSSLFRAFDFELPLTTRLLISAADFLERNATVTVIATLSLLVLLVVFARLRFTAPFFHRMYAHLPIVKRVSRDINLSRFALVLGSLMENGLPIDRSLGITARVIGNIRYRRGLERASEQLARGERLGSALENDPLYPPLVTRMIGVGEESGKLEEVLRYLGTYYEGELDNILKNLSTFIEPFLIITIGAFVLLIALAIISPIYGFLGAIG